MRRIWTLILAAAVSVCTLAAQTPSSPLTADALRGLRFRELGPSLTTGRISDVAIDPRHPSVWYVASASGGLWKTENRGNTFTPIFDEYGSYSLGCVVVDPRDSNIVWLGTGENNNQRSVSFGDGVYKSTDAGKTWTRMGLANSEHIEKILVDPRNSNVVYVTAIGPLWSSGGDRGLYKTTDGGRTWKAVLTIDADTGVTDAVMDPKKPDVIYAASYQRRRAVGQLVGGGPGTAIYKTTNGGGTWTKLAKGLPTVEMGRIGLALNVHDNNTVYALIAAQKDQGGFYRSADAGATWTKVSDYKGGDPGYYFELFVDPHEPQTIWSIQTNVFRSVDGGKTFVQVEMPGVHVDYHVIVFEATDPKHRWFGNDGGLYETWDDGATYRHFTNLPLSQFYRLSTDNARPFYHVCGGAQDNGSICGPSRTLNRAGIRTSDWYTVGGGDGFQGRVDPEDPNIVYAQSQEGNLTRLDLRTGQSVNVRPRTSNVWGMSPEDVDLEVRKGSRSRGGEANETPAGQPAGGRGGGRGAQPLGRWHWDAPVIISPHSASRLYFGGDRLYRSDDRGGSWTPVSPDLTRDLDPAQIPIMGKVWPRDSVAFNQATTRLSVITAIDESPLLEGLLYVGTDDGLVQVSEDGGRAWRKIETIEGLPEHSYVTDMYASPRDANLLFATFNNWQRGDFKPYVMKSPDRGRTWTSITGDLPERSGAWSIVQDTEQPDLLFVGTEFGVYVTIDGGRHWTVMKGGIPTGQARDLLIQSREHDLLVGMFGRGAYVLDDFTALRGATPEALAADAALLPLRDAYLFDELTQVRATWGDETTDNPPFGAVFTYNVSKADAGKLVLSVTDDGNKPVRRLDLDSKVGLHRIAWDLRGEPPAPTGRGRGGAPQAQGFGRGQARGTLVSPGRFHAIIGHLDGDKVTPVGEGQTFQVVNRQSLIPNP